MTPHAPSDPSLSAPIRVRPVRLERDDIAALLAVEHQSLNDSHYTPEEALRVLEQSDHRAHIAVDGEHTVGFCFSFSTVADDGRRLELDMLGVAPSHRRRGLATRLIRTAIADAHERGIARARSVVAAANIGSRRAFWAAGFTVDHRAELLVYDLLGRQACAFLPDGWRAHDLRKGVLHTAGGIMRPYGSGGSLLSLHDAQDTLVAAARVQRVRTLSYRGLWIETPWAVDPRVSSLLARAAIELAKHEGLDETGFLWPTPCDQAYRDAWLRQGYANLGPYDVMGVAL